MTATTRPPEAPQRTRLLGDPRPATPKKSVPPPPKRVPTREDICSRIMRETDCTRKKAGICYMLFELTARKHIGEMYYISQANLDAVHDEVLMRILPDDTDAIPGSLHDDINRHLSEIFGKPVEIVHSSVGEGEARVCTTYLRIREARTA